MSKIEEVWVFNAVVLTACSNGELTTFINQHIQVGYQPQGGVSVSQSESDSGLIEFTYAVLMVRTKR